MKEAVKKLNVEYGFNLTEQEIELVAQQAEEAANLFRSLLEVDLTGVAPLMKIDTTPKRPSIVKPRQKRRAVTSTD